MLLFAATSRVGQLRTYRLRAMQQGAAHAPCLSDSLLSTNLVCRSSRTVSIGFSQFFKASVIHAKENKLWANLGQSPLRPPAQRA